MAALLSKSWLRRGSRIAPLCLIGLTACVATKKDVRTLTQEMARMSAASTANQDSIRRSTARELRLLQDSIRASTELMRTMRGQLTNDIRQLQTLLGQLQELFAQNEQRITQLRDALERVQTAPAQPAGGSQQPSGTSAEQYYQMGQEKLIESPATAELIFQQLVAEFPQHALVPDALLHIGEARVGKREYEGAFSAFEDVVARFPAHHRAPHALLRAGDVAEELSRTGPQNERTKMRAKAREMYNKVINSYRDSGEATVARSALSKLPR
ncbi:MAG: tetratricopeptide repeat protein [Gemmatimonadota bacterium]